MSRTKIKNTVYALILAFALILSGVGGFGISKNAFADTTTQTIDLAPEMTDASLLFKSGSYDYIGTDYNLSYQNGSVTCEGTTFNRLVKGVNYDNFAMTFSLDLANTAQRLSNATGIYFRAKLENDKIYGYQLSLGKGSAGTPELRLVKCDGVSSGTNGTTLKSVNSKYGENITVTANGNTITVNYIDENGVSKSFTQTDSTYSSGTWGLRVWAPSSVADCNGATFKVSSLQMSKANGTYTVTNANPELFTLTGKLSVSNGASETYTITPNDGVTLTRLYINGEIYKVTEELVIKNINQNLTIGGDDKTYSADLFIVAGQSNAAGQSYVKYIDTTTEYGTQLKNGYDNVLYTGTAIASSTEVNEPTTGNKAVFQSVKLGLGTGGNGTFIGPEMGMAEYLSSRYTQENNVPVIVKFAQGATALVSYGENLNLCSWLSPSAIKAYYEDFDVQNPDKTGRLYRNLVATVKDAHDTLVAQAYTVNIKGVVWMQGEADADSESRASRYGEALEYLMQDLLADLTLITGKDCSKVPFIAGEIGSKGTSNGKAIRTLYAKVNGGMYDLENKYENFGMVLTDGYTLPSTDNGDGWHWSASDMLDLGNNFAKKVMAYYNAQSDSSVGRPANPEDYYVPEETEKDETNDNWENTVDDLFNTEETKEKGCNSSVEGVAIMPLTLILIAIVFAVRGVKNEK